MENKKDIIKIEALDNDKEILEYLSSLGYSKEQTIEAFEKYYGIFVVDLKQVNINKELIDKFNIDDLKNKKIIPYKLNIDEKLIYFAINDIANKSEMDYFLNLCKGINYKGVFKFAFDYEIEEKIKEIIEENKLKEDRDEGFNIISWVNNIINKGIKYDASDIHIEKIEVGFQIRYRVDGKLEHKETYSYSDSIISSIYARIKVISDMDTFEKRKPQEGRISKFEYNNRIFDIRVSTVNTIYGEKFVMRLLEKKDNIETFSQLGYNEENEKKIKNILRNKNGIFYVGGATGSGKTTSLYTMINEINKDDINIYTIEYPVEKIINNVNQIQINELAGITYANTLRALLRQDPDVIVVGEINDAETSELSVRASLTGHLVLSTIHANNAIDSISRLIDMGIEPYLIGASSLGYMSQILVRRLCPHCKEKVDKLSHYEEAWLKKNIDISLLEEKNFYKAVGCKHCINGYKGRIAILEILEVDSQIKDMLSKKADLSEIKNYILKNNFKPLVIDGIEKAIKGITTISELMANIY